RAGLALRQSCRAGLEVHNVPRQAKNLGRTSTGEDKEADGCKTEGRQMVFLLDFIQGDAEPAKLGPAQESFALVLPEAINVTAGIRSVRPQAPFLSHREHVR